MRRTALSIAVLTLVPAQAAWIRVASGSTEVITDAGEHTGRQVLDRLESLRQVFGGLRIGEIAMPLQVFVFASESEFAAYRKQSFAAGFQERVENYDSIVMFASDAWKRTATHEYLHAVLEHTSPFLPKWFQEGTADLYSTISISAGKARVGALLEDRLYVLNNQPWLTAKQLDSPPADSKQIFYAVFYAESWALVHMLSLSPKWKGGIPQFLLLLESGSAAPDAFKASFGKTIDDALKELPLYLRALPQITFSIPASSPHQTRVERLSEPAANAMLANLAIQTGHVELARKILLRDTKKNPDSPETATARGYFALAEDRRADAQREFHRAIDLGSRDGRVYVELAALAGPPRSRADSLLLKAIEVAPNLADAYFALGVRWTDDGKLDQAIAELKEATRLMPRRSNYWYALGYAQAKRGLHDDAAQSTKCAVTTAVNETESRMAESLQAFAEEPAGPRQEKHAAVIVPDSWKPRRGDAKLEGMLTTVECDGGLARLHVMSNESENVLVIKNPNQVELIGAREVSTALSCGPQEIKVSVEYITAQKEITRIEFRQ